MSSYSELQHIMFRMIIISKPNYTQSEHGKKGVVTRLQYLIGMKDNTKNHQMTGAATRSC